MKNGRHEENNGNVHWYLNNKLHREDGPAVEMSDGTQIWYRKNIKHRVDGPAVIHSSGYVEYWLYGNRVEKSCIWKQS